MVFNKFVAKLRWLHESPQKKNTALDLDMCHLVWKFYAKNCCSFLDTVRKTENVDKNNNT